MCKRASTLSAALVALTAIFVHAQQANYSVEPDNYIAVSSSLFPGRVDFNALSSAAHVIGQDAINTYWFVKPDAAHVIVQLANGDSSLFLELSGIKQSYVFPADSSEAIGATTDLRVSVVGKDGNPHPLSTAPNARLTVHVVQRDALHLKLTFDARLRELDATAGERCDRSQQEERGAGAPAGCVPGLRQHNFRQNEPELRP